MTPCFFSFNPVLNTIIGAYGGRGKIGYSVPLNMMFGGNFGKSFRSILTTAISKSFF